MFGNRHAWSWDAKQRMRSSSVPGHGEVRVMPSNVSACRFGRVPFSPFLGGNSICPSRRSKVGKFTHSVQAGRGAVTMPRLCLPDCV